MSDLYRLWSLWDHMRPRQFILWAPFSWGPWPLWFTWYFLSSHTPWATPNVWLLVLCIYSHWFFDGVSLVSLMMIRQAPQQTASRTNCRSKYLWLGWCPKRFIWHLKWIQKLTESGSVSLLLGIFARITLIDSMEFLLC